MILDPAAFTPTADDPRRLGDVGQGGGRQDLPSPNELAAWLGSLGCIGREASRHVRGWRGLRIAGADSQQAFDADMEAP